VLQDIIGLSREEFTGWVELGGKLLLALGAICYAVGLVIVNAYLLRYGVYSTSLLLSEYVLAGLLWLFLLAVGSVLVAAADRALKDRTGRRRLFIAIGVALRVLAALLLPATLVGLFSGLELLLTDWRTWVVVAVILLTPGYILPHARDCAIDIRGWHASGAKFADFPIDRVSMLCFFCLLAVGSYAHIVYPSFLPMYGGGRPTQVRLVPAPGSAEVFTALALGATPVADEEFALIAETADWLVLARSQSRSMFAAPKSPLRLRRDMVGAIQVGVVQEKAAFSTPHP
jgi:hypothetical protein